MTTLVRPSVIAAVFAPIGGSDADAATDRAYLERLWTGADRLGMDDPLLDGLRVGFPELPTTGEPRFRLLAGRGRVDASGIRQAYLFARHDVIGLCAAVASSGTDESWERWAELLATWDEARGEVERPVSILGEARVFVAHATPQAAGLADLGDKVDEALRTAGLGAWGPPVAAADGTYLWWWRDAAQRRIVAAISPPEQEGALSRWAWWRSEHEAPELLLYLSNAAKLDYELRVHRERRKTVVASLSTIDTRLADVLALEAGPAGSRSWPALQAAQERLVDAQGAASSVAIELTYLKALRRTVGIARRNLALLTPASPKGADPTADSMFRRDQDLATWLQDQIDEDVGYAEAVLTRAREAQAMTVLRLGQATSQITRAQARVTLLQSSLTAALLAGIGAIAVLQLRLEAPEPLRVPLLFAFTFMLLAFPVLAAHWFDRYRSIDHIAAVVFGAAAGWALAVAGALSLGIRPDVVVALAGMAAGGLIARGLTWVHDLRADPSRSRP